MAKECMLSVGMLFLIILCIFVLVYFAIDNWWNERKK